MPVTIAFCPSAAVPLAVFTVTVTVIVEAAIGLERPVLQQRGRRRRGVGYLKAGGFPDVPTAEDRALVAALTADGARVLRTRALPVATSARREARAPHGFGHYLAELDAATA